MNLVRKDNLRRFEERTEKTSGCWLWKGHIGKGNGYGTSTWRISWKERMLFISAHKMSYRLFKGDVPEEKIVRHTCDVKHCVNPEHLVLGTYKDNMRDCIERRRIAIGENQGLSVMTEENVRELRRLHADGETGTSLAKMFGISQPTVSQITRRVTWRHV